MTSSGSFQEPIPPIVVVVVVVVVVAIVFRSATSTVIHKKTTAINPSIHATKIKRRKQTAFLNETFFHTYLKDKYFNNKFHINKHKLVQFWKGATPA